MWILKLNIRKNSKYYGVLYLKDIIYNINYGFLI